jgi:hypothetical protein
VKIKDEIETSRKGGGKSRAISKQRIVAEELRCGGLIGVTRVEGGGNCGEVGNRQSANGKNKRRGYEVLKVRTKNHRK